MITLELLKGSSILNALTEEQTSAIIELSMNDENTTIANKTRAFWDSIDTDIQEVTGKSKENNQKSYDFLKQVLDVSKKETTKVGNLKEKIKELESLKEDGITDAEVQSLIKKERNIAENYKSQLDEVRETLVAEQEGFTVKLLEKEKENTNLYFDNEFEKALRGVSFKKGIPQMAIDSVIESAKAKVMNTGIPFTQVVEGKRTILFKDENGIILTDKKNLSKPITAISVFSENIGEITTNGGGGGGNPQEKITSVLSAETQLQADKMIREDLINRGLDPSSSDFMDEMVKVRTENNVSSLPIR